ncbi:hypothetical protein V6N13_048718 [Hibiscus sabdariffa]|uniref:HMA domain-containing protein n=1 Tax=Hibiscus sabdariffa TaxID=183260 RepID=A0ABR2DIQ2_9ROSI
MKGMNILCASQASTAIRSSTGMGTASAGGQTPSASIRDAKRFTKTLPSNLCTSQPSPLNPLPYHQLRNNVNDRTCSNNNNPVSDMSNGLSKRYKKIKTPTENTSLKPMDVFTRKSTCSDNAMIQSVIQDQPIVSEPSCSNHQVVVLKVSLHCKGCEGKVRKHLSRMEGVTSFTIDSAAKKVTIVGDVTPFGVLASVSKVKTAQFWTTEQR